MKPQRQFDFDLQPDSRSLFKRAGAPMIVDSNFGAHAAPSPVRAIQEELERAWVADEAKWPFAYTLLFLLVSCGGFWLGVGSLLLAAL